MVGRASGIHSLRLPATILSVTFLGCVTTGVPDWAKHVHAARVELNASPGNVSRLTSEELARYWLPVYHQPAEQLALVALNEIEHGHPQDALLWLALASYRYHQEAAQALRAGVAGADALPAGVRVAAYARLVEQEVERYSGFQFRSEIDLLNARLYGHGETEKALQEQMAALGKTSEIDRESLRDALHEIQPNAAVSAPSLYPELADSFRRRLRADCQLDAKDGVPAMMLAQIPIQSLQQEAVLASPNYFQPGLARAVAEAFPAARAGVVANLGAGRPQARANAAAILALAPSEETRAALEARQAVEPDPRVRLVLAYALVHHGVASNLQALATALAGCRGPDCTLPVMLAEWLPTGSVGELDQTVLARLVAGTQYEPLAHAFAAAALRELQRTKPLDPATVEALVTAGRRKSIQEQRTVAVVYQTLRDAAALSREDVIARLTINSGASAGPDVLMPGPMLARLVTTATAADLPLLGRIMARVGEPWTPEADLILEAVAGIPGSEADAKLVNWFNQYPEAQAQIANILFNRTSVPRAQLERLAVRGTAPARMIIKVREKARDAEATVLAYLVNGSPFEKAMAAEIAGVTAQVSAQGALFQLLRFRDDRYYPNDAVVRHVAMVALLRIALRTTATPPAAPAPPTAQAP